MYSARAPKPNFSKWKAVLFGIPALCASAYNPVKNSIGCGYFAKIHSLKSADGKLVTLDPDLHNLADEVRQNVRIADKMKFRVKFFCTKELDVYPVGSLNLVNGAKIGIPFTFIYDKVENIDTNVITSLIGSEKLRQTDWYQTENGKKLLNSLVLSREAKKFAIARGIMSSDCETIFVKDASTLFIILGSIAFYEYLEARTVSIIGKLPGIILLVSILTVIVTTILFVISDFLEQTKAKLSDNRALKNPDVDYRKGALEYYEKLIERNKSLRALLIDGPKKFDSDGDQITWYNTSLISLKSRIENCKEKINTYEEETPEVV